MFSDSDIPRETIQAYLETYYCVHGDTPTILKVGEANPTLAILQEAHDAECSAFVTACNPFSQTISDDVNAARQQTLADELKQLGFSFIDGIGQHPLNNWPGEASFLVLGVSLELAKALGTRYGQNAIVWTGADAKPQLVLLR
ncbi:DUF3293 domain-containing protein [Paraburkholderia domus]|uniref:DUF3293 domain-containing protein n=1 Tax=Paraburkholderia domus TaxID=2793075 RepID=A0A9N8N711_9BURK|nr:DUF3293 domain-containing protein [Paraburkholderia domus]MBK5169457.1 DUF3293 domain-containing protein [Burkholderia sp. R-70211]CAE6959545.1 hypothetical protein R70211_06838 [Paraburkholderia domus]